MHPKAQALHPHTTKIYVKVISETDNTGYVVPKVITWTDGRRYKIDEVKDFRPADTVGCGLSGDCYTVVINGQTKHLFYEHLERRFNGRYGRWFVEVQM